MVSAIRLCVLATIVVLSALPLRAQTAQPAQPAQPAQVTQPAAGAQAGAAGEPPALLVIYREEVRPGKGAAHAANEAAWSAAFRKMQSPEHWLGMTSVAGPSEAWFLSGHASYAAFEATQKAAEAIQGLEAEGDKFSAAEGDLLSRTSVIMARYRPALSYQANVSLPTMRYMTVDVVRVNPGHEADFAASWRSVVDAHKKAEMKEHWAVFEVEAGMPDTTYLFFYPRKDLAEVDAAGPQHAAAAYRDAVGEMGRATMRDVTQKAIAMSQTLVFRMRPNMSTLSDEWTKVDPEFWTPKPAAAVVAQKKK